MKRFAIEQLKQWKDKKDRKPLIIRGARQVGKTWLMKEFGRTCFENVAYVNFDSNARMKNVFDGEIDIPRIIMAISIETGMTIDSHNTLIIFDEIQEVPKALSSLKCTGVCGCCSRFSVGGCTSHRHFISSWQG